MFPNMVIFLFSMVNYYAREESLLYTLMSRLSIGTSYFCVHYMLLAASHISAINYKLQVLYHVKGNICILCVYIYIYIYIWGHAVA
jgi:hypothetical protein